MSLNVDSIKSSFEVLKPQANEFVEKFYQNLFADFPMSKSQFNDVDMEAQRNALLNALVFVVANLENEKVIMKYLCKMGERHLGYGVKPTHYEWVGRSLLKTFHEVLGGRFNKDLEHQWTLAFNFIAETMIDAANELEKAISEPSVDVPFDENKVVELNTGSAKTVAEEPKEKRMSVSLPANVIEEIRSQAKQAVLDAVTELYQTAVKEELETLLRDGNLKDKLKKRA